MILHIRCGDIEVTFDSEGEFLTPEAARDFIHVGCGEARRLWVSLPGIPDEQPEADAAGE